MSAPEVKMADMVASGAPLSQRLVDGNPDLRDSSLPTLEQVQRGPNWAFDHQPMAAVLGRLANAKTQPVKRSTRIEDITTEPETFLCLGRDGKPQDFRLTVQTEIKVANTAMPGQWIIMRPSIHIPWEYPGCQYTTPDMDVLADKWLTILEQQGTPVETRKGLARQMAEDVIKRVKQKILTCLEYKAGWVRSIHDDLATRQKAAIAQATETFKGLGVDVEKLLREALAARAARGESAPAGLAEAVAAAPAPAPAPAATAKPEGVSPDHAKEMRRKHNIREDGVSYVQAPPPYAPPVR